MQIFFCPSCGFRFQSQEKKNCPRCSSAETAPFGNDRKVGGAGSTGAAGALTPKPFGGPLKSGKEGWQEFHSQEIKACVDCGGTDFELNWKRKEKTCRKCGSIMALPRRSA